MQAQFPLLIGAWISVGIVAPDFRNFNQPICKSIVRWPRKPRLNSNKSVGRHDETCSLILNRASTNLEQQFGTILWIIETHPPNPQVGFRDESVCQVKLLLAQIHRPAMKMSGINKFDELFAFNLPAPAFPGIYRATFVDPNGVLTCRDVCRLSSLPIAPRGMKWDTLPKTVGNLLASFGTSIEPIQSLL